MKIYILGIGGTFMSGIAQLAKEKGYEVYGGDQKLYHPMDKVCLLYTSPSPRDGCRSRMPSSA